MKTKILRIGDSPDGNVFVKIKFDEGKLSITGVIGPKRNGNATGSAGQIDMSDWDITKYAEGWNAENEAKLRSIWHDWHLNDMKPYSPEMKALGWDKLSSQVRYKWNFTYYGGAKRNAEKAVLEAAKKGQSFTPTEEQINALNLPLGYVEITLEDIKPTPREGYDLPSYKKHSEKTSLNWLKPTECEEGLLGKKINPNDEHGYGGKWWKEEVPAEIIDWLFALPDTDITPAWI